MCSCSDYIFKSETIIALLVPLLLYDNQENQSLPTNRTKIKAICYKSKLGSADSWKTRFPYHLNTLFCSLYTVSTAAENLIETLKLLLWSR